MNEKSKAFELIEFVWNNEKTDSYLRVNIAMYEAVKLAIISQMKFNKEDFQNIFSKFSGGYWFGVNANGKGYGVRDYIRFHDDMGHLWDERMRRCDTERVGRVVNHFQNDDNAYFMVINAPNTEVHLITGEIGICSLLTGQRGHFELPRVSYQTSKGNVVLFPDEIMPVDINLLQQEINEGYIMLSDGRYLPPKEAVQQCYNAFGIRVGLGDNWEDIYDGWNKEMK